MVKPPAEYTAANANPITLPDTRATKAATKDMTMGNRIKGHKGGLGLFLGGLENM